jgi:hypothetical protein
MAAERRRRLREERAARRLLHKNDTAGGWGGVPKAWLRRAHRHCRQHKGEGRRRRCPPVKLDGGILGAVAGWCRRVGAVQGVWLRRGRRSGAGVAELPTAAVSSSSRGFCSSSSPLPPSGVGTEERGKARGGLGSRWQPQGFLWARSWVRGVGERRRCSAFVPRPRDTHLAAAGVRLGFTARAARDTVEKEARERLRCPIAERVVRAGPAGDGIGGRSVGERGKGKGGVSHPKIFNFRM